MYRKNLTSQFKLMITTRTFKVSFTLIFVMAMVSYLYPLFQFRNTDITLMRSASSLFMLNDLGRFHSYFKILLPILVVFPFVFSYLDDVNFKTFPYLLTRQSKRAYFTSKYFVTISGAFLIFFIPFMINFILCYITFPENNNTFLGNYYDLNYEGLLLGTTSGINTQYSGLPFLSIFLASPILYNILFIFIASIFASALASFAFAFSLFFKKHKILLILPTFILIRLFIFLNVYMNSLQYRGVSYINMDLMSYIEISANSLGKNYFLFFGILIILFLIGYLSKEYIIRRKSDDFV